MTIGQYMMVARITATVQIEPHPLVGASISKALR
jgi:hypothetical protein